MTTDRTRRSTHHARDPLGGLGEVFGLFEEMTSHLIGPGATMTTSRGRFAYSAGATDDHYVVSVDLPGLTAEDLTVRLDGRVLTVTGERPEDPRLADIRPLSGSRRTGEFTWRLRLPADVTGEGVTATVRRGVLTVTVTRRDPDATGTEVPVTDAD